MGANGKRVGKACAIVANQARARLFCVDASAADARLRLVERPGLVFEEAGPRLRLEVRIGHEIARRAGEITATWKGGTVLLIAERRLLAFLRRPLREALGPDLVLKELARDYSALTAGELETRLDLAALAGRPKSAG